MDENTSSADSAVFKPLAHSMDWRVTQTRILQLLLQTRCPFTSLVISNMGFGEQWSSYGTRSITVPLLPKPHLDKVRDACPSSLNDNRDISPGIRPEDVLKAFAHLGRL